MSKVEKGCLLIEGDHLKLKTKFYPTQYIRFEEATIETDKTSKKVYTTRSFKTLKNK